MSEVRAFVDVRVPLRTVYNQWTQFESFPRFMAGVVAIKQLDDRHTHWVTEVAGARREFDAEIVEQLPDERIAWRSTDGDVRQSGVVSFRPLGGGQTRVTVDLAWEPEGLVEKAGGAIGVDRLQIKADLERFRRFIEDRGTETGQWRGRVPEVPASGASDPAGDVVDVLLAQHGQVKDLMARVSAAEQQDKQQLFTEFVNLLKTHEKGEQRVVHPVTHSSVEGGAETADARQTEEEQADQLLARLQTMIPGSREFDMWFEHLRDAVLNHAEHEEREEFPKLREELSPDRLRTMAARLVAVQNTED